MREVEGIGVIICVFYAFVLFDCGRVYQNRLVAVINKTIVSVWRITSFPAIMKPP